MSNKKVIGFLDEAYKSMTKAEAEAFDYLKQLEDLTKTAMGKDYKIEDYNAYLKDPYGYTVQAFKDKFYSHLPEHLDPSVAFERNTRISPSSFSRILDGYKLSVKTLGSHAPKVTNKGVKSGLVKDKFNMYLDPAKEDHYKALENFVKSAKVLKDKYNANSPIKLLQYCPGLMFSPEGHAQPNPHLFHA